MQLTPKVFDTLLVLVEERGHPVPREELIRRVWPDTAAGKNNLDQNLFLLRKALGDSASEQRYVRTVPKLGYQFAAHVAEVTPAVREGATENGDQPAWIMPGTGGDGVARGEGRPHAGKTKALNARTFLLVAVVAAVVVGSLYALGRVINGLRRRPPTMKITRIAGAEKSMEAAISPDGKYLAYVTAEASSQRIELRQLATNSSMVLVPADGADYFGPVFSRDGDYVYFVRRGKGEPVSVLHRVPALGGEVKRVVGGVDSAITFSPDGRYVVFASDRGGAGRHNVWRMDIGGGGHKQLTHGEQDLGPRVSPDGRWVIYFSAAAGKEAMWRVPIDGGDAEQLVDAHVAGPEASPDGKLIVSWYKPSPDSPRKIGVFPWEGGAPVKVFDAPPPHQHPVRWSADGRGLIYVVTRDGVSNLWVQPADGGAPARLTDFKSEVIEGFDVSRDGSIVCSRGYTARDVVLVSDFR